MSVLLVNVGCQPFEVGGGGCRNGQGDDFRRFVSVQGADSRFEGIEIRQSGFGQEQDFRGAFDFALPVINRFNFGKICTQAASRATTRISASRTASSRLPAVINTRIASDMKSRIQESEVRGSPHFHSGFRIRI